MSQKVPDEQQGTQGTAVVLYQLREEVRRTLQSAKLWDAASVETGGGESVQRPPRFHIGHSFGKEPQQPNLPWDESDGPKRKFDRFFQASSVATGRSTKSANLDHFDEYLRLIWKLSLSLPLRYIGVHPFDLDGSDGVLVLGYPEVGQAETIQLAATESLREHLDLRAGEEKEETAFSVTLDGIELRRPIRLARELRKSSRVRMPVVMAAKQANPFAEKNLVRAGGRLAFEAYLYWNSKIIPKETVGVIIRIQGASGTAF